MKKDIHPAYTDSTFICSCGNTLKTRSTLGKEFRVEVCSECHPFYTGKQKNVETSRRVDQFKKRFAKHLAGKKEGSAS